MLNVVCNLCVDHGYGCLCREGWRGNFVDSSVDYVREQEHSLSRLTRKNQDSVVGCRCLLLVFCLFFRLLLALAASREQKKRKKTLLLFFHHHVEYMSISTYMWYAEWVRERWDVGGGGATITLTGTMLSGPWLEEASSSQHRWGEKAAHTMRKSERIWNKNVKIFFCRSYSPRDI